MPTDPNEGLQPGDEGFLPMYDIGECVWCEEDLWELEESSSHQYNESCQFCTDRQLHRKIVEQRRGVIEDDLF